MISIRVKLENGVFVPQEAIEAFEDGQEYVLSVNNKSYAARKAAVMAMLARTRGMWSDSDAIEDEIVNARRARLDAWKTKHIS